MAERQDDIVSLREYVDLRFKAHCREHAQEANALQLAREGINHRLEAMNELRDQINRERNTYCTRERFDAHVKAQDQVEDRITILETRLDTTIRGFSLLLAVATVMLGAVAIFVRFG